MNHLHTSFSPTDIEALSASMKVGLLATVNPEGLPHLTLLASLQANTPQQMIFGQFTEGLSKGYVRHNPRTGFLIMTLDRQMWRGQATFSHTATAGPEFEMYNNTPMFRYNAYFGIHTVYYLDLVGHTGRQPLPMGRVVLAAVGTLLARSLGGRGLSGRPVLNAWTRGLFNKLDNLKFVAHVGDDGYPVVLPAIQAQAAGPEHIVFALDDDLARIPAGAPLAVFGMTLNMEDVLLRGRYLGVRRLAGLRCGLVQVDWVYSPMPPKPQQIYPPLPLEPVTAF